jgi:hypothetical protein
MIVTDQHRMRAAKRVELTRCGGMELDLSVIAHAPLAVKVHLATVVPAFAIGTWQVFLSQKGSPRHRG